MSRPPPCARSWELSCKTNVTARVATQACVVAFRITGRLANLLRRYFLPFGPRHLFSPAPAMPGPACVPRRAGATRPRSLARRATATADAPDGSKAAKAAPQGPHCVRPTAGDVNQLEEVRPPVARTERGVKRTARALT